MPGVTVEAASPALIEKVRTVVTDDLRGQESFEPGYRITLGYRFDNGSAIEASYMSLVKVTGACWPAYILDAQPLIAMTSAAYRQITRHCNAGKYRLTYNHAMEPVTWILR